MLLKLYKRFISILIAVFSLFSVQSIATNIPFSESLTINYKVENNDEVSIGLYDALGRLVTMIVKNDRISGKKTIQWETIPEINQNQISKYYLKFESLNYTITKKLFFHN